MSYAVRLSKQTTVSVSLIVFILPKSSLPISTHLLYTVCLFYLSFVNCKLRYIDICPFNFLPSEYNNWDMGMFPTYNFHCYDRAFESPVVNFPWPSNCTSEPIAVKCAVFISYCTTHTKCVFVQLFDGFFCGNFSNSSWIPPLRKFSRYSSRLVHEVDPRCIFMYLYFRIYICISIAAQASRLQQAVFTPYCTARTNCSRTLTGSRSDWFARILVLNNLRAATGLLRRSPALVT